MSEMGDAVKAMIEETGYTKEEMKGVIENALLAAYKKAFRTSENAVVRFGEKIEDVQLYSRRRVVENSPCKDDEVELEKAKEYDETCEIGDEVEIPIDPKMFRFQAISTGKQALHQGLNESKKDRLYNQYKSKIGEMITGYFQREKKGNIFLDIGGGGSLEGFMPLKYQSPREVYAKGMRIRPVIVDLQKSGTGVQLILSRADARVVSISLEMEVPELQDGTVKIENIVREAGYKTKVAVSSSKFEVDPVGACVGNKGSRIQNVIAELEGEKIDIIRFKGDIAEYIGVSLAPATVKRVIIVDADKKEALAVVEDSQLALAIGKDGKNVRLSSRLTGWNIDVKTEKEASNIDLSSLASTQKALELFKEGENGEKEDETEDGKKEAAEGGIPIENVPDVEERIIASIKNLGINSVEDFVFLNEEGKIEATEDLSEADIKKLTAAIKENFEFVDDEEEGEEILFCPSCGEELTYGVPNCPNCGVELEYEEE